MRESLLGGQGPSAAQGAVGFRYTIPQGGPMSVHQILTQTPLVIDDAGDEVLQLGDQLSLRATQGDLVADLVQVPRRAAAFPVHAAHRQARVLRSDEDLLELLAHKAQGGQVQHHRSAQTGSYIGRAGRQVSQLLGMSKG